MFLKLYIGHTCVWVTLFCVRFLLAAFSNKKATFKVLDATLIAMMFAIFSSLAHYLLFK